MIYLIYKIHCNITNEDYYGSTKNFKHRMQVHKCNTEKEKAKRQCVSKQIINRGDYTISVIETIEVDSKREAFQRERHYIENNPCINISTPIKTKQEIQERKKEYRLENIESINIKKAEYRKTHAKELSQKQSERYYANRDEINRRRREAKCHCDVCGIEISKAHKARHDKSKTHIDLKSRHQ